MLEPYDEKLSRTVLRGERDCKASDLPDSLKRKYVTSKKDLETFNSKDGNGALGKTPNASL